MTALTPLLKKRFPFILKVWGILAIQVLITIFIVLIVKSNDKFKKVLSNLLVVLIVLALGCIITPYFTINRVIKVALTFIFPLILGLIYLVTINTEDFYIEVLLLSTLGIFVIMSALSLVIVKYNINMPLFGFCLAVTLLSLLITFTLLTILPVKRTYLKFVLIIAIALFSLYISYDTALILKKTINDPIDGANNLYADLLNIFADNIVLELI